MDYPLIWLSFYPVYLAPFFLLAPLWPSVGSGILETCLHVCPGVFLLQCYVSQLGSASPHPAYNLPHVTLLLALSNQPLWILLRSERTNYRQTWEHSTGVFWFYPLSQSFQVNKKNIYCFFFILLFVCFESFEVMLVDLLKTKNSCEGLLGSAWISAHKTGQ